ncbi:MAG: voltage-gated potassium channel [Myxococcota bacterium]|jgi:voltage-gated potassium channel
MPSHIVICGWNDNGERLLRDLLRGSPRPSITIVSSPAPRLDRHYDSVVIFEEDPSTLAGLTAAGIDEAEVIVILADKRPGRRPQDADARTILTVLAIERARPEIHTIAELLNDDNMFHAYNAGVDEVLIADAYIGGILSQAVRSPGMTGVFSDLFRSGTGSRILERAAGVTASFSALSETLYAAGEGVLLGYRRGDFLQLSPRTDVAITPEDRVILLQRMPE